MVQIVTVLLCRDLAGHLQGVCCQFDGITKKQSRCEGFRLKFVSGVLVTLLSTLVSQIQIGIDI